MMKTEAFRNDKGRSLIRVAFAPNQWIYTSFGWSKRYEGDDGILNSLSFLYDNGKGVAAEWETSGCIQMWKECDEDYKAETEYDTIVRAEPHWHFPFVRNDWGGMASCLAVDEHQLKQHLIDNHIDIIFNVLEEWANNSTYNEEG